MERGIYLDTHVVVWLYSGLSEKLSRMAIDSIEQNSLLYSSFVRLELSYLYETGRIKALPDVILKHLEHDLALSCSDNPTQKLVNMAMELTWTRDPFDRLIVSQAELAGKQLVTKDQLILHNFDKAVW